jgi:hypothetical protein
MTINQNQIGETTSYGTIWLNTGNWNGINFSLTTSYKEVSSLATSFSLASPSPDFAMTTDGRLKYTGIKTRNFLVKSFLSTDEGGNCSLAIYKNGSLVTGAEFYNKAVYFTSVGTQVSLATNDYISIFLKYTSNANILIYQATLTAKSIL